MTIHRPAPSRAVVTGRMEEMVAVHRAELLGAHINVMDLYAQRMACCGYAMVGRSATGSTGSRGDSIRAGEPR
ncbi:hypothetical protein [Mycobacteroides abscessus]|uniref:hypothetical protein n=1 Tax=Mycobacteroides abscessus TaxID=36809 RepID=UPI00104D39C9|nr:hypothetical protein [Mycobacteroides abscessus]